MSNETPKPDIEAEAIAFNQRIAERSAAGFVPDLQRLVKCDYFYKSFWRDPHFARLYIGNYSEKFIKLLSQYASRGERLLDVGCGAGYFSLEFARAGYAVTAIDIAEKAVDTAKLALGSCTKDAKFGSLEYHVRSLDEERGLYDIVVFTGVIHHFANPDSVVRQALSLLRQGGLVLCLEPCHERWRASDAAIVALIRGILSATGHWYEPELATGLGTVQGWKDHTHEVREEYLTEKDRNERYQSPNDNASTGDEILEVLRANMDEVAYELGVSFIYRLLGGLRGPDNVTHPLADLISAFDHFAVEQGHLKPNHYIWLGRKR